MNQPQEKYIKFEMLIRDSGLGISPENLCRLFMNFSKLDEEHHPSSTNRRGTGLGLSICKSLIELMGGTVGVESEVGKGTTFRIELQTKCRYVGGRKAQIWKYHFKQRQIKLMS